MVLISQYADSIPYSVRVLGDEAVQGAYVQTGSSTWVDMRSIRDNIVTYYSRHLITRHEYEHYLNITCAVFYGYYFDSRFTMASMDDPKIRMNIIIFLETYGDIFVSNPAEAEGFVDDLMALRDLDEELWGRLEEIPDEDFRPDVTEIVDLTNEDVDNSSIATASINWDDISIGTISLLSGFDENEPIDWNIREAFEPPTEFEI